MQDTEYLKMSALNAFRAAAPIDTGNLRYNSISIVEVGTEQTKDGRTANVYEISVDDKIAPYAVYTNEAWLSPTWRGKHNPNEGWVERGVENIAFAIAQIFGGEIMPSGDFGDIVQDTFEYEVKQRRNQ